MKRNGVATVMAVVIIGLVAVVLTAAGARAIVAQQRAATATAEAQASRLLAAVAQVAREQLHNGRPVDGPIDTPVGQVALAWSGTGDARSCVVDVACGRVRRAATLTFQGESLRRVE